MAKVMQDRETRERIEDFLAYLIKRWAAVPELAAEWGDWDEDSRVDFVLDWPICEDRLGQIRLYAEQGVLTPTQRARYQQLMKLVAQHRSTLERLIEDDAA